MKVPNNDAEFLLLIPTHRWARTSTSFKVPSSSWHLY